MKYLATIKAEFEKFARKWHDMPYEYQVAYIKRHPSTRRKVTNAPTPKSETSGLKIHEPVRSQSHSILDTLRAQTDAESSKPEYREYVTMREGSHNKYHYFAVFKDKTGNYVAANAYGRIGYPNVNVAIIGSSPSKTEAIRIMSEKLNKKMKKGYNITQLPAEAPKVERSSIESSSNDYNTYESKVKEQNKIVDEINKKISELDDYNPVLAKRLRKLLPLYR